MVQPRGLAVITGSNTTVFEVLDNQTAKLKLKNVAVGHVITASATDGTLGTIGLTASAMAGKLGYDDTNTAWGGSTDTVQKAIEKLEDTTISTIAAASDTAISTPSSGQVLIYDGSNSWDNKSLSGQVTINSNGVTQIATSAAGAGLAGGGGTALSLDINELAAAAVDVANDSIAIVDANDSNAPKKEAIADVVTAMAGTGLGAASGVLSVDLNGASAATVDVAADSIAIIDANDSNGTKKESIADLMTAAAGNGLAASSGVLAVGVDGSSIEINSDALRVKASGVTNAMLANASVTFAAGTGLSGGGATALGASSTINLDLNSLNAASVSLANDSIAIIDADDSNNPKKESLSDVFTAAAGTGLGVASGVLSVDLSEAAAATINVANDSFAIIDADDSNATKKESIADFVAAIAGSNLTATNGVLAGSSATLTVGADSGSDDTVTVGTDTLEFAGTANEITTTVSDNTITFALPDNVTIGNNLTVTGDLTVEGTTTTFNSTAVEIQDKVFLLATGSSNAEIAAAGGAGLMFCSDDTDGGEVSASFLYDGVDSFDVTDHMNLASGNAFKINNTTVIDASGAEKVTATVAGAGLAHSSGVLSVGVDDSSIQITGDTLNVKALGVTNAMLAGSIANSKLTNDSVTVTAGNGLSGGGEVDLGAATSLALDLNELSAATVAVGADSIAIIDADDNSSKKESITDLIAATAGTGLAAASGVLSVDLNEVGAAAINVAADSLVFMDADASDATKKESIADLITATAGDGLKPTSGVLSLDLNELTAAAVAVGADSIAIIDADDNSTKKEAIADVISATAGTGLTATSGVLSVDLNQAAAATISVANDSFAIIDADGSNATKKESIADFVAAIAGANLTATNGVLAGSSATLTITADSGSPDNVTVGTDTIDFEGTANEIETAVTDNKITFGLPNNVTVGNNLTVNGNLTVEGTTTTVNSTTVEIQDKIFLIATGSSNAEIAAAGGAGLAFCSDDLDGAISASFLYDGVDSFDVTDHMNLASGNAYKINNATVIDANGAAKVAAAVAGDGLAHSSGVLSVGVDDSSIETSGDALRVKASGVTNAMLANSTVGVTAGDGLSGGGSTALGASTSLALDLNELTAATVAVGADSIAIIDADDNSSKKESIADLITATAGDGLKPTSGVLSLDLNELTAADVAVASDSIAIIDAGDNSTKKESIADLMIAAAGNGLAAASGVLSLDANELSDAAVASGDKFVFEDATDNSTKKESIDDIATLFAGTGLAASSAVLSVDLNEVGAAAIDVATDSFVFMDANASDATKKESIADLITATAGDGLKPTSGVLSLDLNELTAATVAVGADSIAIIDADDNSSKKETIADLMTATAGVGLGASAGVLSVDLDEVGAAAINVANDSFVFMDADASDATKKESIADFVAAIAGSNLTATNGVLAGANGTLTIGADSGSDDTVTVGTDTLEFAGTANEIVTTVSDNTITFSQPNDVTIGQDLTVTRNATITGNLIVNGTTTTVNSTAVEIQDKVFLLATGSSNAEIAAAGGAGLAFCSDDTDGGEVSASFLYDGVDSFDVTDHMNLASGNAYKINNATVIDANGAAKVAAAVAGDGLAHSSGVLSVGVDDSSIETNGDALRVKASGVTNAMLANSTVGVTAGNGLSGGGTPALGASTSLALDLNELTAAAVAVGADSIAIIDADDNSSKKESIADLMTAAAGDGLSASSGVLAVGVDNSSIETNSDALRIKASGVTNAMLANSTTTITAGNGLSGGGSTALGATTTLALDLNELSAAAVAVASDSIAIIDADDNSSKKETIADLMTATAGVGLAAASGVLSLDANELSAASVASGDNFVFVDATDNSTKKESIDDIATLFAGTGLAAASAVLSVDLNEVGAAAINVANDSFVFMDADASDATKKESIADLITATAGDGLKPTSGVLSLDLNELTAATVAVASDSIAIIDADDNSTKKESIADLITATAGDGLKPTSGVLSLDLNELTAATVAVSADSIAIIDATDNSTKKESIADLVAGMAGTGITASNGQLSATAGTLTVGADSGSDDAVTVGTDTLEFAGTANEITTTVSNNTITFALPDNVTLGGDLTVMGNDIKSSGGVAAITLDGANVTIPGNLTVNGTTNIVNSTTVQIDDKNIELAHSPDGSEGNDAAVDGGGITLKSSNSDKTFNWVDATDAWTSSEHMDLATGKSFKINGAVTLSATTLGSAVVASSLTSVGTLTSLAAGTTVLSDHLTVAGSGTQIATLGTAYQATDGTDKVTINGSLQLGKLDGNDATQQDILEYLAGAANGAANCALNGQMIYVTNKYPTSGHKAYDDFDTSNKFYFCEEGVWHSSPFATAAEE